MVKGKSLNKYCEYLKITEDNVYMSKPKKKKKNKDIPTCSKTNAFQFVIRVYSCKDQVEEFSKGLISIAQFKGKNMIMKELMAK